ncbi:Seryl-tRNA synthetase [Alkalidesulfovibrio alkalitolerans DSM 16529]|uniref:Serine--tRNA ligase n=1 Tax=Alkalidesulfovibrio alkalitolerans DSM 16529 TaxID=1121439 RepID=S7T8V3_9BACT|nr:serine--tRNA ligase [Alkalidesulfovibrio alkalitolerans]EPR33031.1 Seryl-tRNA synthetase [Alkalidesulfovibrio alkalitolerans DSM 16529]
MLDIRFVRNNPEKVREALAKRGAAIDMGGYDALDAKRRAVISEVEELKARRNQASKEVAQAKRTGGDASAIIEGLAGLSERIKALDEEAAAIDAEVQDLLLAMPNIPHESVPVGKSEADNPVVRTFGEPTRFSFPARDHVDLGVALHGIDFERAAKISGARFAVLSGWAAALERALTQFMLDLHTRSHCYREVMPPVIVNTRAMTGTGQLPKFAADLFKLAETDYWLIPTAEVPVTNLYAGETLAAEALPLDHCAFTPCFRSEAGSYGRDTRGLIRLHQFNKVELVRFVRPEESYQRLEELTGHAEAVLKALGLPYRVIELCTGDLGFSAAKTYDIEVWLPGQNAYREISSCSNFEDFQARRAGIRFKEKGGKGSALVHTLNGSGLAVGRTMVAVIENGQQEDGSVVIPEALRPYMGGLDIVRPV